MKEKQIEFIEERLCPLGGVYDFVIKQYETKLKDKVNYCYIKNLIMKKWIVI